MHRDSHRPATQAMGYGTAHGAHGSVPSWGPSGAAVYSLTEYHACKDCNSVASVTTLGSQRICLSVLFPPQLSQRRGVAKAKKNLPAPRGAPFLSY